MSVEMSGIGRLLGFVDAAAPARHWRHRAVLVLAVALAAAACFAAAEDASHPGVSGGRSSPILPAAANDEAAYLAANDAAMTKMMHGMAVQPTGDVDRDFVAMMVPHHQGAIEMAQAVLRYGHNAQIRRIAQEIIVDQLQEIAAMRLAIGEPLPPATASPTQVSPADATEPHSTPGHPSHMQREP